MVRAAPTNAGLSSLSISSGTLSPVFDPGTNSYAANVTNDISSVAVTPVVSDTAASATVNGMPVQPGFASRQVPLSVGLNTVSITVTAGDGVTTNTYTITVTRAVSTNANLAGLTLSSGALSPVFDPGTNSYTSSATNDIDSVTFTPVVSDTAASVTVNGIPVQRGSSSGQVPLAIGSNTVSITVTAGDGVTTNTYTITVTRAASTDANLADLTLSSVKLTPPFESGTTDYTASVNIAKKDHTIYTMGDSITAKGEYQNYLYSLLNKVFYFVDFGIPGDVTSNMLNRFPAIISARPDYVIILGGVNDARTNSNAIKAENNLQAMYTAAHNAGIKVVALTITPFKGSANWTLAKQSVQDSVNAWMPSAKNVDYLIDTYTGLVDPSNPYQLLRVYDSGDHLHPSLSGENQMAKLIYAGAVFTPSALLDQSNAAAASVTLTPSASSPDAAISVNGQPVISGEESAAILLSPGPNTIAADVTAQDTSVSKTYNLNVTGLPSNNADLANLYVSNGDLTLNPFFSTGSTSYTSSVNYNTLSVQIRATPADSTATVTINGASAPTIVFSNPINLNMGLNTITTTVTAQDGTTTRTYTLAITRAKSSVATLSALKLSGVVLTPVFAAGTNSYTAVVPATTASVTVTPVTSDSTATATVNGKAITPGAASATIILNNGPNTIVTVVTAQDDTTTDTYTITVYKGAANAKLSNLKLSSGPLSPAFNYLTTGYAAAVTNATTFVTVTPAAADANATITVNGAAVTTKTNSSPIALALGANTINIVVTAQNGVVTNTYTITVTRAASTNAKLGSLSISSGALSPVFDPGTNSYTSSVTNDVSLIVFTPVVADTAASVTVNGTPVQPGAASGQIPLPVGSNTVSITVTAGDGVTTNTYTITVTRAASTNANLGSLSISSGALSPVFDPGTNSYTSSVTNDVSLIVFTPVVADTAASVTVNGTPVQPGAASGQIPLPVGSNTVSITVTAGDGVTTNTYTITVTRATSTNANLGSLSISSGALSPVFDPGANSYASSVTNDVSLIAFTPIVADTAASVMVNGMPVQPGSSSGQIPLHVGSNTVSIMVTAGDGVTTNTYTITVTRATSTNANLGSLSISSGALSPVFDPGTNSYTSSVTNDVSLITFTPLVVDTAASVTVNGMPVQPGTASGLIPLPVGLNTVSITVTAGDGVTINTYTIRVTRVASTNANLAELTLSSGVLSPVFDPGTNSYTADVTNDVGSITFTPFVADTAASVTVNGMPVQPGSASGQILLSIGSNTISIMVTAGDEATTNTYTITVTRAASTNANLADLTLSSGALSPVFDPGTNSYTSSVTNDVSLIVFTPVVADTAASVTVNGTPVQPGATSGQIALPVGSNAVSITVTAGDGATTNTYTITVTRAASTNANLAGLNLFNSGLTLSPLFSPEITNYTATEQFNLPNEVITATTADTTAKIAINGTAIGSGMPTDSIYLSLGPNVITTTVTAQDGITTKTYTVVITRTATSNANLSNLQLSNGIPLLPAFSGSRFNYITNVSNAVTSVQVTPVTSDSLATVTVNSNSVLSGSPSQGINLNEGVNTITTAVTSEDGTVKQGYVITITRALSSPGLSALHLSAGTLSPAFSSALTSYSTSVGNSTASVTITPTTTYASATVMVNGISVVSGTASPAIPLTAGQNNISVLVTAINGSTQTYTVTITRAASANANLARLLISSGTLTPAFAVNTNSYTASEVSGTPAITITPTTSDPTATVIVNGNKVASGTVSGAINLNIGSNTITIVVTAQNGTTTHTYTITIYKGSNNAYLSNLKLSNGVLSPVFNHLTNSYTANITNAPAAITITPTTADTAATITVNGTAVASKTASALIPLTPGLDTLNTVVTAQNGLTVNTYTIVVHNGSSNANLALVRLSSGTLSPAFAAATNGYTASVANSVTPITVTPTTVYPEATVTVNGAPVTSGTASLPIALAVGSNIITLIGTAQDGITTNTYTVTVTRAASGNANLALIRLSSGTLSPAFAAATTSYTASVNTTSIKVTPTASDAAATIAVNGTSVASGTASASIPLVIGPNTISLTVTAQSGVVKTYTVTVTRAANGADSYNPGISVSKPAGTIFIANDGILVHPGLSPNGDGINDFLQIDNISQYPDNKLAIMNRNGQLIYEAQGYNNSSKIFDGHSNQNGQMQLPGTYFYRLDYTINGIVRHKTGFIVLKY